MTQAARSTLAILEIWFTKNAHSAFTKRKKHLQGKETYRELGAGMEGGWTFKLTHKQLHNPRNLGCLQAAFDSRLSVEHQFA